MLVPIVSWRALQASRRTAVSPPSVLIAYFYEGNDLDDTISDLALLRLLADPAFPADAGQGEVLKGILAQDHAAMLREAEARTPEQLSALVAQRFVPHFQHQLGDPRPGPGPALYVPGFLTALAQGELDRLRGRAPKWAWDGKTFAGHNRARIGGHDVEIPGTLQAPSMQLSAEETEQRDERTEDEDRVGEAGGADREETKDVGVGDQRADRNGVLEESGIAAAVLNHPANGIAWLANKLAIHEQGLEPGEIRAQTRQWPLVQEPGEVIRSVRQQLAAPQPDEQVEIFPFGPLDIAAARRLRQCGMRQPERTCGAGQRRKTLEQRAIGGARKERG